MATKASTKTMSASNSAAQGDSHFLDDQSTLNAINQILQRSDSLEIAVLNSLELVLGMRKVAGAYLADYDANGPHFNFTYKSDSSQDLTHGSPAALIAEELKRNFPQLPDWALRLDLKLPEIASGTISIWLKRVDNIHEKGTPSFLILTFSAPVDLAFTEIQALDVASSILRHKISIPEFRARRNSDPLESPSRFRLSERQVTISKMILDGLTNKEIAQELSLSAATIRYECVRLYERLGAKNRASAAAILQNLFTNGHDAVSASRRN